MKRRDFLSSAPLGLPLSLSFFSSSPYVAPETGNDKPDLVNLHDVVQWIEKQSRPKLSFLDPRWESVEEWKAAARPEFLRLLHYAPPAVPLAARSRGTEERMGFTIEKLSIAATEAYEIPAWLLLPARRQGKIPGIVAQHCHGGCYVWGHEKIISHPGEPEHATKYREEAYGRPYAEELARRGYAVLVIDAFYFGSRRLLVEDASLNEDNPSITEGMRTLGRLKPGSNKWYDEINHACGSYENLVAKSIFTAGSTWPGILSWDDRRALDYLCSRAEVESSRIGAVGLSIGGLRTAYLIASDPRIKASCVVGWMTQFGSQIYDHLRHHTWMIYIPGLYHALDLPDAAALTAPGALMVQQCAQDGLYPLEAMKGSVSKLERIFQKAGIPDRFQGRFYDLPHSFTPAMQEDAFKWFDRWLKG
jgi:dienelactone hydrolase